MTLAPSNHPPSALDNEQRHRSDSAASMSAGLPSFSLSSFAPLTIDAKAAAASTSLLTSLDMSPSLPDMTTARRSRWSIARLRWLSSAVVHCCVAGGFVLLAVLLAVLLYELVQSHEKHLWQRGFGASCTATTAAIAQQLSLSLSSLTAVTSALQHWSVPASSLSSFSAAQAPSAALTNIFVAAMVNANTANISYTAPANPALLNMNLLAAVDLSSLMASFNPAGASNTSSSVPMAAPAVGVLSPSSVWLLQPVYSSSSASPSSVAVAVVDLALAMQLASASSGYDMRLSTIDATAFSSVSVSSTSSFDSDYSVTQQLTFVDRTYTVTYTPTAADVNYSSAALLAFSIVFPLVIATFASFSLVSFHHLTTNHTPSAAATAISATTLSTSSSLQHKHQTLSVLGFFLDRLNNPLHQILSLLQFLQDTKPTSAGTQQQQQQQQQARSADEEEIVYSIREQALIMQSIVADALDIRTLDPMVAAHSSLVQSTGVHWPSMIAALLVPLQQQAAQRQVTVTSAVEAGLGVMCGDCRRLQQCVSLLLSSVIGLTAEGGTVSVRVKAVRPREEKVDDKCEQRKAEGKGDGDCSNEGGMRRSASLRGINVMCPTPSPHSKLRRVLRIETDQSKMALASSPSSLPRRLRSQHTTSSASSPSVASVSSSSTSAAAPIPASSRSTIAMQLKVHTSTAIKRQQLTQLLHSSHSSNTSLHTPTPTDHTSLSLVCRLTQSLGGSVEVRRDTRGTAFVLYLSFGLTPAGDGVEVAREMLASPLPNQSPRGAGMEGGGGEERGEDEYAVLVRSSDDGVEVEDVLNTQYSVSSSSHTHTSVDDVTLAASPLVRARTTPLNVSRRMKADEWTTAEATDKSKPESSDDNKSIEHTTVNQASVSSATTLPSLPLLSFSPFTHAENTPLSACRASSTPSASPSFALSSMSSSSLQLHTPSPLLGRSFTENAASNSSSFSLPTYSQSIVNATAYSSSPSSSASSIVAGSSVSSYTPVSSSHSRRRSHGSGLSSEMTLMTRQVAEARLKLRQSDGALYGGEQAVEEQPLSLLAAPRRLVDRVPALDMADGGSELLGGRAVSAPSCSAPQQRSWRPTERSSGDAPLSPLSMPPERATTSVRSHTTTIIRPSNAPSTSPGPTRAVGNAQTQASSVLPANYSLHSPQTSISTTLSLSASSSPIPHSPATAAVSTSSFSLSSTVSQPVNTFSATPPLVPRQRTPRRSPEDDKRVDSIRAQLSSLSVLVVDDSDINLKIALRMLQGIECETATDGRQAVDAWRRRAGVDGSPALGEEKKGSPRLSATASPLSAMPPVTSAARSQSAAVTPTSMAVSSTASATSHQPFSLILCDIVMPVSGLDATRAIRTLERQHSLSHTPIIAVTANCTRSDRREAKAAGMDYLLAKPFTRQQLFEVMQLAMKEKGAAGKEAKLSQPVGDASGGASEAATKRL